MYVTIVATKYGNCPEYQGAELKVPATREAIQDAMDRARAQGDEAYRMITFRDWPSFLRERLSKIETDIQEVNFLASRVDGMNQEGLSQYEGVLACIETEREGQECSIKDLINASYNMERFELMPGVVTDAGLGEHAVDLAFVSLRFFCGGYHADSYSRCFFSFALTNALCLGASGWIAKHENIISGLFFLAAVLLWLCIFKMAPLEHENRPFTDKEKLRFRKRSIQIYGFWIVIGIVLWMTHLIQMEASLISTFIAVAILMIGEKSHEKRNA